MHFNGVLILIRLHVHPCKLTRLLQLSINCNSFRLIGRQLNDFTVSLRTFGIYFEIIQWSLILFCHRKSTTTKPDVMRRTQYENAFTTEGR